jgi:glycosyltransferase involved in cell wall biosynthesis
MAKILVATDKPFAAIAVKGIREVVEGAGLLFPAGNEKYLAYCITKLLIDKQYYNQISERCFNRAFQYDIHMMVEKYIEEYKKVLSKKINAGSFHRS